MFSKADFSSRKIPSDAGVYIFRDQFQKVIYVGKAKSLRKRLSTYFQASRLRTADPKLRSLIKSIAYFQYYTVRSNSEAVLLETRFIKEYQPRYNILMRDDKNFYLIKVDLNTDFPRLILTRLRKSDGAEYFGPFTRSSAVYATVNFLNRYFGIRTCKVLEPKIEDKKHCKEHIIRQCSAPCDNSINRDDYREKIFACIAVLNGDSKDIICDLNEEMLQTSRKMDFERAATYRDIIENLKFVTKQERKFQRSTIDPKQAEKRITQGLEELQSYLSLDEKPQVIECFDNSNFQGSYAVSSMVQFQNGKPAKKNYRHFQIKTVIGPDDFASMYEVVTRRYRRLLENNSPLPNAILIDGGKGQLSSAVQALDDLGITGQKIFGIAKRYEIIYQPGDSNGIIIPDDSPALHILQHLRDEAHRFAINYHRKLRNKNIEHSILDDIPGIGKKRKEELLRQFPSISELRKSSIEKICQHCPGLGKKLADQILTYLNKN